MSESIDKTLTAATIFLSAFLLFLIQPLIAKTILPWFGGSAAVWATCLLFFQAELLLGYLYAHASVRCLQPKRQALAHLALLGASLLALPLLLELRQRAPVVGDPALSILALLLMMIGLPYLALSATSPLLQAWQALRARQSGAQSRPTAFPYRLYALSNVGSVLALASYPFVLEPRWTLRRQSWAWALAYAVFALLCAAVAARMRGLPAAAAQPPQDAGPAAEPAPGPARQALWLALAACSSALLLAVTNHLSQNVAAIPLLWLLPLSLYLLSFIIAFGPKQWRWQRGFLPFPALAVAAMAYAMMADIDDVSLPRLILVFCAGLFVLCLFCHGELARLKPDPRHLTGFYLMISIGGALGGLFVALAAPHLFKDFYELPITIAVCAALAWLLLYREPGDRWWNPIWLALGAVILALGWKVGKFSRQSVKDDRMTVRNFYGVLRISQGSDETAWDAKRTLTHGTIMHGEQFLRPERHMLPTTYYGPDTGVGRAVRAKQMGGPVKVGVIGLGTGTMAAFGRPGDEFRFYDINPLVREIATTQFSFLKDSPAKVEVVLGDARLSLEREADQGFDVLVVDAFSSDAIPVHLLTREAFDLYFRHLKPGGILAVHVSNRYVDLEPVVAGAAKLLDVEARSVQTSDDDKQDVSAADWVLVSARRGVFAAPLLTAVSAPAEFRPELRPWTDDYSNLYQILKR
jgi:SAM-dependent methyltransferase